LFNSDLTAELACKVGLAVASSSQVKTALVARDTRVSGHIIEDALVSGLIGAGVSVSILDIVPTPTLAFLTKALNADVGFMITASHNPPMYNGIKIFDSHSLGYADNVQGAIEKKIADGDYSLSNWQALGKVSRENDYRLYIKMVKESVKLSKPWRVVVDPGCGATCRIGPLLMKEIGCEVIALNAQPDGFFPARSSEPTEKSLSGLCQVVKTVSADLGIAFDGDGDRVAFIDNAGHFIDSDRSLSAFAGYIVRKEKGGTVVTNVEASMSIETMVQAEGGKVIRSKVGDVWLAKMIEEAKAVFGGEPCGAWIHPQHHLCPDGPLSAALFLKALEETETDAEEFVARVPEYVTLRENIICQNKQKTNALAGITKTIRREFPSHIDFSEIDGIRLALENGWILIRASGTEPLIRLTVEGESLKAAKDIMAKGKTTVENSIGGDRV
jgi:phosphoglucosamine mutase